MNILLSQARIHAQLSGRAGWAGRSGQPLSRGVTPERSAYQVSAQVLWQGFPRGLRHSAGFPHTTHGRASPTST